jgi:hypothetical protein
MNIICLLTVIGLAIATVTLLLLRPRMQTIEDGKRLVIYRLGRFERLAGPGPVTIHRGVETIERIEDVRNQPLDIDVDGLYPQDLPVSVSVNLWAQFAPEQVAAGNRDRLRDLLLLPPHQRREQIRVHLRDALMRATRAVNAAHGVSDNASPLDKVLPAVPGTSLNDELMQTVASDLAPRLRQLGLILDLSQSLKITQFQASEADSKSFSRDRLAAMLRQRFPNLSDSALAQLVAAFEGRSALYVQDIHVEGINSSADLETSLPGPGGEVTRVAVTPRVTTPPTAPPAEAQPEPERLSKSDLQVLKPVPPKSGGSKRAA